MSRGKFVDGVEVISKFGLFIVTVEFSHQSFSNYKEIYISKRGTLIGKWGTKPYEYKDYLIHYGIPKGATLLRITSKYLFFKI